MRKQGVVGLARGLRAFFKLEVGVTRGPAAGGLQENRAREPELEHKRTRKLEVRVQSLNDKLRHAREELKQRNESLRQARSELVVKDRQTPVSSVDPETGGADGVDQIVERFHKLYYESNALGGTWRDTFWMGVPLYKCPLDMWIYQEILFDLKPDIIIETGTAFGGSALYLACMCDLLGKGKVITVDVLDRPKKPQHERIEYVLGSSTDEDIVDYLKKSTLNSKVLVFLDSDHSKRHVLDELRIYGDFVEKGGYMVVEDSNVNGHPIMPEFGPGPMEALEEFVHENEDFVVDDSKEKFFMTFSPKGYLKKVR